MRVELLTDWPERLVAGADAWLDDGAAVRISRVERGGRVPVLHFDGISSREAAQLLAGRFVEMPAHDLPDETWYWSDLIGLRVEGPDGAEVGELVEIFRAGGNEVYRVVGPDGERLVPALRDTVLRIDPAGGVIVVADDASEEA